MIAIALLARWYGYTRNESPRAVAIKDQDVLTPTHSVSRNVTSFQSIWAVLARSLEYKNFY